MKKKIALLISSALLITIIVLAGVTYKQNEIDIILSKSTYSYLPKEAKNYIKEVYEETGEVILSEKNKEENKPYLNPDYVKYLETGKASEYGYVPEPFITDHSYIDNNFIEKHGSNTATDIESLSYYNLRDEGYIENIYDQGSEGLCWAFSNTTALESHLALKSNKQTMLTFSEKQIDYATTLPENAIDTGKNPFYHNSSSILGINLNEGGNMIRFVNATAIGVSPVLCKGNCSNNSNYNSDGNISDDKYWKYDYSVNTTLSPYEILNSDITQYTLNSALFFNPLTNDSTEEVNALVKILKNQIVNNGSLYVGVGAYTNLSIEYTPRGEEKALNSDGKNIIYYIPRGWEPEDAINHAISIIGWDDNYTHKICLDKTRFEITDATKNSDNTYTCNSNTASIHTINGAWIAQNSWGDKDTFIYLPYNSMKSSYSSIAEVETVDYDNSYRATSHKTYINKGDTKEVLNKIKIFVTYYNPTINIYYNSNNHEIIIKDGNDTSSGTLLETLHFDYPGLYTIDLLDKNIIFDESVKQIAFTSDTTYADYSYYASIHTNNVDNDDKYIELNSIEKIDEKILAKCNLNDNKCISTPQKVSFDDNNALVISGITRGLNSNDNLTFKVLDEEKNDVTSLFHFFRNFSVSNYINALISYNDDFVELGTYTIEIYYKDTFYDDLEWNLTKHNNTINGLGTEQNPHKIRTIQDLNDIRNHTTTNEDVNNVIYGYYVLENDLDLTFDTQDKNGALYNNGAGWEPIYKFAGNFEGNNHVITGLFSRGERNVGLFGTVFGLNNYIRNLILKDPKVYGEYRVGGLIGGIYESNAIDIHDIAIINGYVSASKQIAGGIIGLFEPMKDSSYSFYNLFNNSIIYSPEMSGGIIGFEQGYAEYGSGEASNIEIFDTVNLGKVTGSPIFTDHSTVGGIISWIKHSNNLNFRNIITVGEYSSGSRKYLGDIFGGVLTYNSINISNVYYLNNLYGEYKNFSTENINKITNNTKVVFNDIITNNYIDTFEHNDDWTYPVIDGIKRIPMLKQMVKHFDFTEKIEDFELWINITKNIKDMINPNIDTAKNIEYTYDSEYLSISSSGVITPKKIGTTTIHVNSLYDGYEDDIQVSINETVSITYKSNYVFNDSDIQHVFPGQSINLNKNAFQRKGYLFKNWNTQKDGTGTTYTDEQFIEEGITEELILYAQWTPITYNVEFDSNNGTGKKDNQTFTYDLPQKLNTNTFAKEGFKFKEWNTKADGTGTAYTDEQSVTNLTSEDGAIINLYAIWEKETYSVTFDANGGTGTMENQTFSYGEAQTLNEISFVKEGFKFKNWNTKADGTGTAYSDKQEIGITENLTLYAQWEETYSYRINNYTYDDNKMYISKINIDTTVDEYKSNFTLNVGYTIDVNYKTVNGQNVLYTGSKTKIYNGQNLIKEYTNIVTGDVNGDGKISVLDIIQINNHIIDETNKLGEIYAFAGNYNGDTRLSVLDIIQINNYIIGE